jgi:hypothetical protein
LVLLCLLLFSGHRYEASSSRTLEIIKACIPPDVEDAKGYDSVCFNFIPL